MHIAHFDRIIKRHRGHTIWAGDDVRGVGVSYAANRRRIWKMFDDLKAAIAGIDEAHAELERKITDR